MRLHIVWVSKYRYRVLEGSIKEAVKQDTRALCEWKEVEVIELSVQPDHIHLVCSIPPKLAAKGVHGIPEGKTSDQDFQELPTPVGMDEVLIRRYVRCQEQEERSESASEMATICFHWTRSPFRGRHCD